jgi:hypothetical protein
MWGTDQGTNVPEVARHDQVVDEAALAAIWLDEMSTKRNGARLGECVLVVTEMSGGQHTQTMTCPRGSKRLPNRCRSFFQGSHSSSQRHIVGNAITARQPR